MTLDDETARRIVRETVENVVWSGRYVELVRAGYAARDAEVEELRAQLRTARRQRDEERAAKEGNVRWMNKRAAERDAAMATLATLRAELDILRATEDGNLSAMRERAEKAEATLTKVREYIGPAENGPWHSTYRFDILAILDESPTERETPADEVLSGRIVTASFETGEPWPCGLEDCECPEHDSPAPPKGTYVTVRLDDEEVPVGLWPVRIARVPEIYGEVVPDGRA